MRPAGTQQDPTFVTRLLYDGNTNPAYHAVWNLTNGVEYEFILTAFDRFDPDSVNNPRWVDGDYDVGYAGIKATPITTPGKVTTLYGSETPTSVYLSWDHPDSDGGSEITDYIISTRIGKVNPFDTVATVPGYFNHHSVRDLATGMPYEFVIAARNSAGIGPISDPITVTPAGAPGAPLNFTAVREGDDIRLSWDAPNDGGHPITHYSLSAYLDRFNLHWIGQVEATQTTYLVTGLPDYNTVEFRLYATTDYSAGSYASVTLTAQG